jgi:hypothetical protein
VKLTITGPLFKWFGSKWLAAKHYPEPRNDGVLEPFAGSAGYSLRHPEKQVVLAEADPNLFALWSWLITEATEQSIKDIPVGVPEGTDIRSIGLSPGQALLLKCWQRTNNVGNCWTISPWGDKPGQWTANTRARVSSEFQAIQHWKIVKDGLTLLEEGKSIEGATWFIDPPYQYNYKYLGWDFHYPDLAQLVYQLRGEAIVCEAADPKSGKKPDWLPFQEFRRTVTSRRKAHHSHHSLELYYHHTGQ